MRLMLIMFLPIIRPLIRPSSRSFIRTTSIIGAGSGGTNEGYDSDYNSDFNSIPRTSIDGLKGVSLDGLKDTALDESEDTYEKLKMVALQLIKADVIYYDYDGVYDNNNDDNNNNDDKNNNNNNTSTLQFPLSDSEYDSLAKLESSILSSNPSLKSRWEVESGLGTSATRFGGRVGSGDLKEALALLRRYDKWVVTKEVDNRFGKYSDKGSDRVKHIRPMLSLDNAMTESDVKGWVERTSKARGGEGLRVEAEPKVDGVSLSLVYERVGGGGGYVYELKRATTRGRGTEGEDVTMSSRAIKGVLEKAVFNKCNEDVVEVRGEVRKTQ